jgi:predicted lipase
LARQDIENEIDAFRRDEQKKMKKEIDDVNSNRAMDEALQQSHKQKIISIEQDFKNNKQQAVDFLVKNLLEVDLTIPDVVIGRFSHKLMVNAIKK